MPKPDLTVFAQEVRDALLNTEALHKAGMNSPQSAIGGAMDVDSVTLLGTTGIDSNVGQER